MKLSPDQHEEIRALFSAGNVTQKELADKFSVSQGAVSNIVKAKQNTQESTPSVPDSAAVSNVVSEVATELRQNLKVKRARSTKLSNEVELQNFINILEEYLPKLKAARHRLEEVTAATQQIHALSDNLSK